MSEPPTPPSPPAPPTPPATTAAQLKGLSREKLDLLIRKLRGEPGAKPAAGIARKRGEGPLPLSAAQQRLWFLDQLEPGSPAYNVAGGARLLGALDAAALSRALDEVVRRHEALRTTFAVQGSQPVQVVGQPFHVALPVLDLRGLPAGERTAEVHRRLAADALRPFDLARGPLLRAALLAVAAGEHVLLVNMHHIVSDGWSMGIFLRELGLLYGAFKEGKPSPLPELTVQYPDYAQWQREQPAAVLDGQLAFWREQLQGVPTLLDLPADHPPAVLGSPPAGFLEAAVPAALQREIAELGRRENLTPFMVLLAAFGALLARRSGQPALLIGSPIANRRRTELEGLIGFFVNTLVLRVDVSDGPENGPNRSESAPGALGPMTGRGLLERMRRTTVGAFDHQDTPFEKLVEELAPQRDLAHSPLVQVMFAFQNAGAGALALPGLTLEPMPRQVGAAKLDLMLTGFDGEATRLVWEYSQARFEAATVARLAGHFERLLEGLVRQPDRPVLDLPLLSAAERQQLLEWNATAAAYAGEPCLHELIAAQAAHTPDAVALVYEADVLTYAELAARAGRLAGVLRGIGIEPEVRVGICVERSLEMMVGLLGVLEAGGAYVPLDPSYPAERLAFMLADLEQQSPVLLTQSRLLGLIRGLPSGAATGRVICLDEPLPSTAAADSGERPRPDHLAYMIYTSGSTGRPKGAMNSHRAIVNRLLWMQEAFGLTPDDRVVQKTPISFDVSVWELFWPLLTGARLVIARPGGHQDPVYLARLFAEQEVTTAHFVPSMLQVFLDTPEIRGCSALRRVVASGEALPADLARRFFDRLGWTGAGLHNLYGPTEAAVDVTWFACEPQGPGAAVPIGRPVANTRIHLLDRRLAPVPAGVPGELYIGGVQVGRGYLDRPALTAEKLIPDHLGGEPGARLYASGDLARFRPDGTIEFLGRIDNQVKLRGFRIEPGEIEAALAALPAVREAAVVVREDQPGDRRLVAYVVPADDSADLAELDAAALRTALRDRLPEHMIPAAVAVLPTLPLTPSGKLDRRALVQGPAPEGGGAAERPYVAPQSDAERLVAGVWGEVLNRPRVGREDHFFDLGGHSLLATQVVLRLREALAIDLPLRALFEAPTVAGLARAVEAAAALVPVTPASGPSPGAALALSLAAAERYGLATEVRRFPASFAQERLWFLDQLEPGSPFYNINMGVRLAGRLDVPAFAAGLREIVRRHGALRTTFEAGRAGWTSAVQVVHPAEDFDFRMPVVDLAGLPAGARAATVQALADDEARRPFDLAAGPLFRVALLHLNPEQADAEHTVLLTMHHIVSDGWSMGVFVRELAALYAAYLAGKPSPLPPLALQYADFSVWQRQWLAGEVLERQLAYWRRTLADAPAVLELPADRPRPSVQTFAGGRLRSTLPPELAQALNAAGRAGKGTLFMALLAGFQALLGRLAGAGDLVVGSPIANRQRVDTEPLIGFFVNTLALRGDLAGDPTFPDLLARVREITLGAYAHQDVPFEKLVEELAPERSLAHTPLFQVLLVLQNAPQGGLQLPGLTLEPIPRQDDTAKFDLTLAAAPSAGAAGASGAAGAAGAPGTPGITGLDLVWEYNSDLFDPATIERLAERFARLLGGALAEPRTRLSDLPLLSDGERAQVLGGWARAPHGYPRDRTIHELFAEQAARTPGHTAVVFGDRRLTYAELDRRADRLAWRLRGWGVGPEVPVALAVGRSLEMVVATLAILKAGGAYLPLDPAHPRERLAYLLADGQAGVAAPLLLTEPSRAAGFAWAAERGVRVVALEPETEEPEAAAPSPPSPLPIQTGPDSLAYVMYTSGSTGEPKGVAVVHRAVVRLVRDTWYARFGPDEVFLQLAPVSFDAATLEIWGALLNGGRLAVMPPGVPSLDELGEAVASHGVTTLWLTAGLFHQMVESNLQGLAPVRQLLAGGDALSPAHVARVVRELPGTRLINGYGPTENTTFTCCWPVAAEGIGASVPIGRPIANTEVFVLDRQLKPVPPGVPGELLAGGDGLARGYLNRPDLTAERFVPHPYAETSGQRLYRTGDRVRWLPDGTIEFLGRIDRQVKIRGFRIEPGEIEAVLAAHPGLAGAALLVQGEGIDKRLVAYIVAGPDGPSASELRAYLRDRLPEHMVPAFFVPLPELPLTANGKVDRRALTRTAARPAGAAGGEEGGDPPQGPVQEKIAAIWQELLGVEGIGAHQSFFDLGGHSLLATRLVSRVWDVLGADLSLRAIFETPTVAGLAAEVEKSLAETAGPDASTPAAPPLVPVPRDRPLPLSYAQERLWFLDQLEPGSASYNVPAAVRLAGDLDLPALAETLTAIVRRHEALRTVFAPSHSDGEAGPVQVIRPPAPVPLPVIDLAAFSDREQRAVDLARAEALLPFDLQNGPLLRAGLLRLAAADHILLLSMHHIVSDGWSMGVLVHELGALYAAFHQGRPAPLPPLPVQYADFAVWQRTWLAGEELERQVAWWRQQLHGAPAVLELPADRPRPAVQSYRGSGVPVALGPNLSGAITDLGRRTGTTPFMVLLAAFQALLGRVSGQDDLVVGSPIANRRQGEVENLIGFFVNTLALRGDLSGDAGGDPDFEALLARTREATLGAYAHQDVPFEKLVEALQPERSLAHAPIFQVMLALQNAPGGALELPGLHLTPLAASGEAAKFDLHLALVEGPTGITGSLGYALDLFDRATAARLAGHLATLLEGAVGQPERRLSELPLLTGEEVAQLRSWNRTGAPFPAESCLHELIADQAARTPGAPAVRFGGRTLCYRELEEASNRLARRLRRFRVGQEVRVGVCAERSLEMVVALVAVLKSGGAYVPLDPGYPVERLAYMLEDSGVGVLLTQGHLAPTLPAHGAQVVLLDELWTLDEPASAPAVETVPESLAYMIYTSGSTGRPKGAMNAHRGIVNRLAWMQAEYGLGPDDRVLQKTPFSFDVSVWEFFWPLITGACLVVAKPGGHQDPNYLVQTIAEEGITTLHFVPSMLQVFVEAPGLESCTSLRRVLASGEALPFDLVERWYQRMSAPLHNLYGPTEAAVDVTYWPCAAGDARRLVPIGRPVWNTRIHLLDRWGAETPVGVAGELYIGGVQVGRGYLGRPELTAERFVPDGLETEPGAGGARLYRTGDLARRLPSGEIEYLGRVDFQVKVRGFRIELGEIEAALLSYPDIREAIVLAREDRASDLRLVAYLVGQEGAAPQASDLRAHLGTRLPEYMIPSTFVALPQLPLSPNGKVDRKALPAPEAQESGVFEAPRTPTEELVAGIYAEVLGRERIGAADSFFELGGHSLLATQVVSRLRETFGVELPLRRLFETPTVAGLAAAVEAARAQGTALAPPIRPVDRDDSSRPLPLSYAQERLWFLDQLEPGSASYNLPAAVRLTGDLDETALGASLSEIVRRHEALRTTFAATPEGPVQRISPPAPLDLPLTDLSHEPDREERARALFAAEVARPFDLAEGPLLRALLLRLSATEHVLVVNMHHVVSDGWSIGVFVRELGALYRAFHDGQPSPLPPLPVQYADFAAWQRGWLAGDVLDTQLAWWRGQLAGLPAVLELPTDRPRPAVQSFRGASVALVLPAGLARDLAALARRRGATFYMALLAGFQALLARHGAGEDIPIGSPVANRTRAELEPLIGFFVNTLVLRGDLTGSGAGPDYADLLADARPGYAGGLVGARPGYAGLLARTREATLGAYAHQDVPFEKLVEVLQPERSLAHAPLFQVMLILQNAPGGALDLPGLTLAPVPAAIEAEKFDLTWTFWETAEGLQGGLSYARDLFDRATAERLAGRFAILLAGAVADPETAYLDLPLLTEQERNQLLVDWTNTGEIDGEGTLAGLFAAQAARTPEAQALIVGDERLTYAELAARAASLARHLCHLGVGPEERVAVCANRSADLIVALLAVLEAGGAYVPIDPAYPKDRQRLMLEDSRAAVLLTQEPLLSSLPGTGARVVLLDRSNPFQPKLPREAATELLPDNLAYFIYTSGSTGRPKGVAIAHRSAVAMVRWARQVYSDEELSGTLLATSVCFDLSVYELFVPLAFGGRVILAENALALPTLPARDEVTLVNTVPSAIAELVRSGGVPASVKTINLAGEALQQSLVDRIYALGTVEKLWNLYGPSEDTTYSTWVLTRAGDRGVTIGRPLPGTRAYVLDPQGQPSPAGVPGELCLGGAGLARGYFDRPDLTAERFVPNPWETGARGSDRNGGLGARLYRTGDLVRWLPEGDLEFLGRIDHQVKVRGFRIELGEIEAALLSYPDIREAVVLAREDRASDLRPVASGDLRLIAYVVGREGAAPPAADLRAHLRTRLPEYMIPSAFVELERLPLSPNGKIDRKALPAPDAPAGSAAFDAPRGPVEELVAGIWREILGTEHVGIHTSFFELGGHSLLATRMVSRLRETLGVELPLRRLFEAPTVAGLAAEIEAARAAGETPAPALRRTIGDQPSDRTQAREAPLSFAQERLWFLDQFEPGRPVYNLPTALRFTGPLDLSALAAAFAEVVRRHEALRTTFAVADGRAVQVIAPALDLRLPLVDLSALPEERREPAAARLAAGVAWAPFDLAAGPLVRGAVVRLAADNSGDHALLFAMHHIVSDGWSLGVLVREVAALYGAFVRGLPSPLPELPVQYADFAAWQRDWLAGEALERQIGWWRERLAGAPPVLPLPLDHPRPPVHTFRGERRGRRLPAAAAAPLLALGRRHGATPFMTLLAAWDLCLARHTGELDLPVGTPIANRTRAEVEGLIGFFVNTLVLRTEVPAGATFPELLAVVRETALGAYAHQDLPFEKVVEQLAPERNLQHTPLFQVMFVFDEAQAAPPALPGLTPKALAFENKTVKFDLTLIVQRPGDDREGLQLLLGYNTDLFRPDTIDRMLDHLVHLLEGVAEAPDRKVFELPFLGGAERHQLISEWNDTAGVVPAGLLHSQFEDWARRRPEAPALVFGDEQMSYGDLAARSEALAAVLRGLGVGPEVRVGLCLERSFELFVGLLGILKAGGAYVPLDPANPAERLRFQVEDARAPVLLTQRSLAASLQVGHEASVTVVCLDEIDWNEPLKAALGLADVAPPDPDGLAYVIYTSGSTGTPNGVLVPHRGAVNLIREARELYQVGPESRILQTASVGFDASVLEIFLALSHGGSLCLVREEERLTPSVLTKRLVEQGVSTAVVTPSLLSVLPEESLAVLRSVSVGGEACSADLVARWARGGRRLLNCYGPTEATIFATVEILAVDGEPLIGRPVANVQAHVVDAQLAPVPVGVAGELLLGGVGLARGYLDRPERTAEKFVPDSFPGREGARLYRTGDLVRLRADGRLEFLGRIDDQVKVRGFRIELGEVEAALLAHPDVASAVVLAPPDKSGAKRLVAYVTAQGGRPLSSPDLRRFLETTLPDYMVPAHVLVLDALPLTPGGKVDRRSLPNPEGDPQSGRAYIAPRTAAERFVAEIWQQVLGIDRIGARDDFFALGGSSIKAALLTNLLQERLGEYVYVVALFDAPTLEKLAAYLLKTYPEAMARVTGMRIEERCDERRVDAGMLIELREIIEPLSPRPDKESAKNARAAFILSPPRSGSTLLRVMLAGNPNLFAPPELELLGFNTLQERKSVFTGRWELWTEGTIRALMEVFDCDADEAKRRMEECEARGLTIQQFYRYLQDAIGSRLLVDKTPSYSLDAATLERAEQDFDQPLYIHLLRHPNGMIRSFEKAKLEQVFFRPEHSFSRRQLAELIYDVCHENIFDLLSRVAPERHLQVRFEDMVKDPRGQMERLCGFLGVPFDERMLDPYADSERKMTDGIHALSKMVGDVKFHEHKSVDAKVAETWRKEVKEDFLGDVTWDTAVRLGYPDERARAQKGFSPLVRLQAGEPGLPAREPLFLVHPVGGNVLCYAELARSFGPEQPVYGLQSLGLGEGQQPQQRVEEMAATYLEALREVQPHGPYRLGGWSIGGVIAYEMAQQLRQAGEEVELLALLDTVAPAGPAGEQGALAGADDARLLLALAQDLSGLAGRPLQIDLADLQRLAPEQALDHVLAAAAAAGAVPAGAGAEQVRRLWSVFRANVRAIQAYAPQPYAGRIALVRALRHPHVEPALGWDRLVPALELIEADADHYTLLRGPAALELGRVLADRWGGVGAGVTAGGGADR
jgi:amino acid adenylation domain-containing protein